VQREITKLKKAKEDASAPLAEKAKLENAKKAQEALVADKQKALLAKVKLLGNYVHETAPVSQTGQCAR